MRRIRKFGIVLGLAVLLVGAPAGAAAKSGSARAHQITGIIVSLDREARTLEVRELGRDKAITVRVPAGQRVRVLTPAWGEMEFERLHPAMYIKTVGR
ncbi:MAG: hypothetical protein ACRD68_00165 [Pyrinomonadaceae bacterium]